LTSLASLRDQRQRQVDVQRTADEARQLATARYRAGLGTFLTVLQAQAIELAQRRVTIDLDYRVIDTQIALVRALGGGYRSDIGLAAATASPRASAQERP
jgi:outer membrane protein TolC